MFPNDHLYQTAVYWSYTGNDGYGSLIWNTPIEISCRWIDSVELKMNKMGKEIISKAQVQIAQDVLEDGMLYLGTLSDLTAEQKANPKLIENAFSILTFEKTPCIKANTYYREVFL